MSKKKGLMTLKIGGGGNGHLFGKRWKVDLYRRS